MIAKSGTMGRAEFTLGGPRFDFVMSGEMDSLKYTPPLSKTVNGASVSLTKYAAGIRVKTRSVWLRASYNGVDSIYLHNESANVYTLKKASVPFGSFDIRFFGQGQGYSIGVDAEAFYALGTVTTSDSDTMKYSWAGRGCVRVDFGKTFHGGIQTGIETHQYSVSSDKYFRTDFYAGISFGYNFGGGKSGSNSYDAPGWPVN